MKAYAMWFNIQIFNQYYSFMKEYEAISGHFWADIEILPVKVGQRWFHVSPQQGFLTVYACLG